MFSSALVTLFVSMDYAKTTEPIFTIFSPTVAYGPRKKSLDFGIFVVIRITLR